ncbi:MAG TPA: hypothetical protein ENK36_06850 [Desulfobacterales bacterium]|nr:hypothetical protein [Desulfobacterales bacterium]
MNEKIPQEIIDAVNTLELWEKSINLSEKNRDFEDAMDILNEYAKDNNYISLHPYIKNIKKTYTRKLIEKLPALQHLQIDEWVDYTKILLLTVPEEVELITKEAPQLKKNVVNFIEIWRDEFVRIINPKNNSL